MAKGNAVAWMASVRIGPRLKVGLVASTALGMGVLMAPHVAAAQVSAAAGQTQLDEVVVTATKREQSLQEVPMSITAISGAQIDQRGIEKFEDYARGLPGVSFQSSGPGQTKLAMRGIPNLGVGATVSLYVDDTPLTSDDIRTATPDPGVLDVDHIEVLRGPQGTLYGASSMGGTIRVITRKPELNAFNGKLNVVGSLTDGGDGSYGANGVLNVPVVEDRVALRLSGFYRHNGGFVDQIPLASVAAIPGLNPDQRAAYQHGQSNINSGETYSLRAVALLKVTDNFTLTPSIFTTENRYDSLSAVDSAYGGRMVDTIYLKEPYKDGDVEYALSANYDLGAAQLTSATSYVDRTFRGLNDETRFMAENFGNALGDPFRTGSDVHIFTQEVRLASQGKHRIDYVLGGFYWQFDEKGFADQSNPGEGALLGLPVPGDIFYRKDASRNNRERALFGELTFNATDALHITGGLRAYSGSRALRDVNQGFFNGNRTTISQASADYNGVNPKVSVSYDVNSDVMLYATAAKGYRAGGANISVPTTCAADLAALGLTASPASYAPDKLWNYEAGAKTSWANGRLTANGAIYHIDWTGIQVRQPLRGCGFSFLTNGASATSDGFELELAARPVEGLTLNAGVGYAHTSLDKTPNIAGSQDGSPIPGVPDWTGNISATYTRPLTQTLDGTLTATYQYGAGYRSDLLPPSVFNFRSETSDLSLRAEISSGRWTAGVFADNLLNKVTVSGATDLMSSVEWLVNRPRTVGVRLSAEF